MIDQAEIHRMAWSEDVEERKISVKILETNFSVLKDQGQAWVVLYRLTQDKNNRVRRCAADALNAVYYRNPRDHILRIWYFLISLTQYKNDSVRMHASDALGAAYSHIPGEYKRQAWNDLHKLTHDVDRNIRRRSADALGAAYSHIPEEYKRQAWNDLHKLTHDEDCNIRRRTPDAIDAAYSHIPKEHKQHACEDLHRLIFDTDIFVRSYAVGALGNVFSQVQNKIQAWEDLHRLTFDTDIFLRSYVAGALGSAFPYVPNKKQAWEDLHRLISDAERDVRIAANHSSGRVSIFRASEAEKEDVFRKEMENALGFFEKAAVEAIKYENPSKFCLPFYRSFYTLTFKKEEADAEVQRYLSEAKSAIEGSESKEKLFEAVENLGNALKEAQKARDFNDMKSDLNAYRRYCDRACELLDTTEYKAPGASRLIRKGLPIIDERIKGIIAEIQEKAKALCKQVKDTEFKEIGQQVNNVGQELSKVIDPIRLEKEVSHMLIPLSAMCKKMPEEERGEACEILKRINDEQYVEDKLSLINMLLSKFSSQMDKKNVYVNVEESKDVQVIIGNGNYQG